MFKAAATEQLKVPGHINHLGDLRDFVTQIGQKYHLPAKLIKSFKLAVDEAATNIIYHAYKDQQSFITIKAIVRQKSLTIVLIDQGNYFHPNWAEDPDIKSYAERGERAGLGLFMIRRLIDQIDYRKTEAGNELHLTQYFEVDKSRFPAHPLASIPLALKAKHFVVPVILVTVMCLAAYLFLYSRVDDTLRRQFVATGHDIAGQIVTQLHSVRPEFLNGEDGKFYVDAVLHPLYEEHVGKIYSLALEDTTGAIAWSTNLNEQNKPFSRPEDRIKHRAGYHSYAIDGSVGIYEFEEKLPAGSRYRAVHVLLLQNYLKHNIQERRMLYLKVMGIVLGLTYVLLMIFSYFMTNPVRKLSKWVEETRDGDESEMDIDSSSEIGAIAQAFNDITQKFKESQQHLQDQEHLEKEIQLAKDIQNSLLPKAIPQLPNFEIAACYEAAQTVGGDYYDFIQIDDNKLGIVIADVAGKGVPASLVMTMIRTALRTEARGVQDAAEVLTKVNDFLTEDIRSGMFVTVLYLILDTRMHQMNFASAGHTPLILYRSQTQRTFYMNPIGFPIGVQLPQHELFSQNIQSETVQLQPGDTLLLYTDGVTEAMNPRRELFGEERLLKTIREHSALPSHSFVEKLKNSIYSFREDGKQFDDITFVTIRGTVPQNGEKGAPLPSRDAGLSVEEKFLSIEDVTKIMDVLYHHPDYDAHDIAQELNTRKYGYLAIPEEKVMAELNRRQLYNIRLRRQYVTESKKHNRSINPPGTAKLTVEGHVKNTPPASDDARAPRDTEMTPDLEADFVFGDHIEELLSSRGHEHDADDITWEIDADDLRQEEAVFDDDLPEISSPPEDTEAEADTTKPNAAEGEQGEHDAPFDDSFFLEDISDHLIDSILDQYTAVPAESESDLIEEPGQEPGGADATESESIPPEPVEAPEQQPEENDAAPELAAETEEDTSEDAPPSFPDDEPDKSESEEEITGELVPLAGSDSTLEELLTEIDIDDAELDFEEATDAEPSEVPESQEPTDERTETAVEPSEPILPGPADIEPETPVTEADAPPEPEYETVFEEESLEVDADEEVDRESDEITVEEDILDAAGEHPEEALPPFEREDQASDPARPEPVAERTEAVEVAEEISEEEQLLLQGIRHYQSREYEDALIAFKKVVKLDPDNAVGYQLLGNAYYRNNMLQDAVTTYELAKRYDPDDTTLNENLGMIYAKLGQFQAAYEVWQVVLQNYPERREIMNRLQRLRRLINGESKASAPEAALTIAAEHDGISEYEDDSEEPTAQTDLMNAGIAHYRNKEYEAAIDAFKNTIEAFPELKEAYILLGNAYFRNNMLKEAAEIYELLTQMDTEDSTTCENKGVIYARNGLYQEALREWKKILSIYPERSDIKRKVEKVQKLL